MSGIKITLASGDFIEIFYTKDGESLGDSYTAAILTTLSDCVMNIGFDTNVSRVDLIKDEK